MRGSQAQREMHRKRGGAQIIAVHGIRVICHTSCSQTNIAVMTRKWTISKLLQLYSVKHDCLYVTIDVICVYFVVVRGFDSHYCVVHVGNVMRFDVDYVTVMDVFWEYVSWHECNSCCHSLWVVEIGEERP